jgi:lipopolysaccharide assembly outer membrane protein LptD (OstA)
MNLKLSLQIFLFALILLISYLVFKNYFSEVEVVVVKETLNKTVLEDSKDRSDSSEDSSSIIENLEYKSIDSRGNKYIVKAGIGETKLKNQNILILQKVNAKINLIKKSPILIVSDYAEYNSINFDTKFFGSVIAKFEDNKIKSDNLDLFFKDNLALMYNNIYFTNSVSKMNADKINLDLLTGDIIVQMFESSEKIKIKSK